jgi:hypothetical protein
MQQVLLLENDIGDFVSQVPGVELNAGEFGQVVTAPIPSITGNNVTGFWDTQNQASPFFGAMSLDGYQIQIINDGQITFTGSILNINADYESLTANVNLRSDFQTALESGCIYVSPLEGETPSQAAANILTLYDIPVDAGSFAAATSIYSDDNVLIRIQSLLPDQTILGVLQLIADVGVARISLSAGVVRYDVYNPDLDTESLYTFSNDVRNPDGCTILEPSPNTEDLQKDLTQGYTVEWAGTPTADFGADTARKKTVSGPSDGVLQIMNFQAAVWIGERWLAYLQRPQRRVTVTVPVEIAKQLDVGYPVSIQYGRWGAPLLIDIVLINASEKVAATIGGVTR